MAMDPVPCAATVVQAKGLQLYIVICVRGA